MNARFRVRLRDGGDLTVPSLEELFQRVATGVVNRHDLIHDALTGQWAPAGTLPVFWLCTDLLAHGVPPGAAPTASHTGADVPDASSAGTAYEPEIPTDAVPSNPQDAEAGDSGTTDFALADPLPALSPQEEARSFIARMDEERAQDGDAPPALADLRTLEAEVQPEPRPAVRRVSTPPAPRLASAIGASTPAVPRAPVVRRRRSRPHLMSVVLAGLLGTAGIAGGVGLAWPWIGAGDPPDVAAAPSAREIRTVPPTEEEMRDGAGRRFLEAVRARSEALGVGAVPEAWLEGRYLADAGAYPEVEAYWLAYREVVDGVRRQENDLYRSAYLEQVQAAGISGPVRSLRLATAMADFTEGRATREAVYRRVGELVDAALALHTLSARAAGRISYEPARANRVSADPVIEAAGTDAQMQAALDAALDRVLVALHGEEEGEGPGREGVEGWLAQGLGGGGV